MEDSQMNLFIAETFSITQPHFYQNRREIDDIIRNIFQDYKGTCDVSSSQCSSALLSPSEYSYDKRLKYWKDVLEDRRKLEQKITKETNKDPGDVLYKRLVTIDERDKQTVRTILDYAERMNPTRLITRPLYTLPEKCNRECQYLTELRETLPLAERHQTKSLEISGLPKSIRLELLGKPKYQGEEKPRCWLKSKALEAKIVDKREDIERVLEFYPDIENLEVVGKSINITDLPQRDSDIQLLNQDHVCEISSDSKEDFKCCVQPPPSQDTQPLKYAFKLNDQMFYKENKKCSKEITIDINFATQPYGREVKKVMTIQNVGKKVLNFSWSYRAFYNKNPTLLKSTDNEFVWDNNAFRLSCNQTKEIVCLYQPRKVDTVRSKWVLKVEPCCFCRKLGGIELRLIGVCTPHPEYTNKLEKILSDIITKSNLKMMRNLTSDLGEIVPQIEPTEAMCPYKRTLNDVEIFEQLNEGFKCDRYHDLQLLQDLYQRVKRGSDKEWDFKVDTVKCAVLNVNSPEWRALYFSELTQILDNMRGQSVPLELRLSLSPEKDKSRLLYVKGIICSTVDEWEEMRNTLEESFLQSALRTFLEEMEEIKNAKKSDQTDEEIMEEEKLLLLLDDETKIRSYVLENRVKTLKAFCDTLHMQTYTMVCNFTENIVNIIESTEVI